MIKPLATDLVIAGDILEIKRATRRLDNRRLLYDCFHCRYNGDTGLCYCDKGLLVSRRTDGMVSPAEVLRGERFTSCQECAEFDGEE